MLRVKLALVLVAAWIALSIGSAVAASVNFHTVDRVLVTGYRAELAARTPPPDRTVLRYLASEINRRLFRGWAVAQVVLVVAALLLVLPVPAVGAAAKATLAAASAAALANALALTPRLLRAGPPLDFVARPFTAEWEPVHRAFMRLHGAYMAVDLVKLALLVATLVLLVRVRERSRWAESGPAG